MKKKVLATFAALSLVSSVGFASPLNDFSQGKVAVDVSVRPSSDFKVSDNGGTTTYDAKSYMDYDLTVGLGNNLAFQYKGATPQSKDYSTNVAGVGTFSLNGKLTTQEFNLLYKTNDNFTVFTGINQAKAKWSLNTPFGSGDSEGDTKSNWQVGVTGQTQLGENLIGYATIAAGQDVNYWTLGLGYAVSKNLDINVFYGENKYNKVKYGSQAQSIYGASTADYTVKGIGYGITYKF